MVSIQAKAAVKAIVVVQLVKSNTGFGFMSSSFNAGYRSISKGKSIVLSSQYGQDPYGQDPYGQQQYDQNQYNQQYNQQQYEQEGEQEDEPEYEEFMHPEHGSGSGEEVISDNEQLKLKNMEILYPTAEDGFLSLAQRRAEYAKSIKANAMAEGMTEDEASEIAYQAAKTYTASHDTGFVAAQGDRVGDQAEVYDDTAGNMNNEGFFVTDSNLVVDYTDNTDDDDDEPKLLLF